MLEPIAKLHDSEKSMIFRHLARICMACPNRADGGLPKRAGEEAQSQDVLKGRFCASKSFAIGSLNICLIISYDGTRFFGWQKTKTGPSIQEELEKAATQILGCPIQMEAASRTDRGVHAKGQAVHFKYDGEIDCQKFQRSMNAVLPKEISVRSVDLKTLSFHPTLDATHKEYHYFICNGPVQAPMDRLYSWHVPQLLNIDAMLLAAKDFIGQHDFSAFTNERTDDTIRCVRDIKIIPMDNHRIRIELTADRFLYKMARNIVGTIVQIGLKKWPFDSIPAMIASKNRKNTGMTAPPFGLFLIKVFYSEKI